MRVFVAGATGVIGSRLVPQLIAGGHEVTATTTRPQNLGRLESMGAAAVVLDGLDPAAVGEAVARAEPDAIVHQMTALSGTPDLKHFDRWFAKTNELRTKGTEHLLAAASAAGVDRFVAQSYTGWPNAMTGGRVKTEDDPLDGEPAEAQRESLAAIRFLEDAVTQAPLAGAALRFGALYGPGASDPMVELVRKRGFPIVGDGAGVWSWIHVDDAVAATTLALERGARGVYNVVDDDPASVSEWLPHLAQVIGAKPPRRLPVWLARAVAGEVSTRMMTQVRGASSAKIQRELGWRPTWSSWRDGFRYGLVEPSPRAGLRELAV